MQPSSGNAYVRVSAAGTTVTSDKGCNLNSILIGGTYVGSVEWYDSATAAGTAAGNLIFTVGLPQNNLANSIVLNARTKAGLVCVATGTPSLTYTIS